MLEYKGEMFGGNGPVAAEANHVVLQQVPSGGIHHDSRLVAILRQYVSDFLEVEQRDAVARQAGGGKLLRDLAAQQRVGADQCNAGSSK